MREAPESFKESLKTQFNGLLRIRWSDKRQEWQIEEKIARASGNRPADDYHDEAIRFRDGYALVCSVRPGDRMPCEKCNSTLRVPVGHFGEVKCDYCKAKGRNTSIIVGYFPLNDLLLEHLRKLDPIRGYRETLKYEGYDTFAQRKMDQEIENMSPIWSDNYKRLVGIPMVGYTGKER